MRTTLDLDEPTEIEIIRKWQELMNHGDGRVFGRVSSSGEGVHLKVHGCTETEAAHLREYLGDDPDRRRFDRDSTLKPKQILFTSKPGKEGAGEWRRDRDRVLAEYRRRCPVEIRYPEIERP